MTGVLIRLERDGLVKRGKSAEDQRRMSVSLTERGHQRFDEMAEDMEQNYQRLVKQFGEDRLKELLELLNVLKTVEP